MPYDTEWSEEYLKSDGNGNSHQVTKLGEFRAFAALARAQGHREIARSWQELAVAEEKRLQWEAEQGMHALDQALDTDGLDKQGQQAWVEYESEEEFGTPNATYCQSMEPDHNGGWFCYHPACVTSPDECECGNPLVFGHECSLGYWNGRQYLVTAKTRQR